MLTPERLAPSWCVALSLPPTVPLKYLPVTACPAPPLTLAVCLLQIPNARFWGSLGGLVKDGIMVSMGNTVEKREQYEPVPRMDTNLQAQGQGAPVIYGGDDAQGGRRSRRSRGATSGDVVVVVGPDGKKKKRKKKKGGEEGVEKIVVVDPVTGKKKVKRKVKKGEKDAKKQARGSKTGGEAQGVQVKKSKSKSKGGAAAASLE
jgi:hypothetical protein